MPTLIAMTVFPLVNWAESAFGPKGPAFQQTSIPLPQPARPGQKSAVFACCALLAH
jgi:hypothetical protein